MATQAKYKFWAKGQPSAYQLQEIPHDPHWDTLIISDAFFNNLASGFLIISCLAWLCGPGMYAWVLPVALTLALLILATDLIILIADLGDSWRFFHSLRLLRFTAPLSVGVWGLSCMACFLTLATICMWIVWAMGAFENGTCLFGLALGRLFTIMALVAAAVVICYKGVVFSCSSQPGVKNCRWLTSFMVADSLVMGTSLYILMLLVIEPTWALPLIIPMITLIVARTVCFGLLWQDARQRARQIYNAENDFIGWTVLGFCGALSIILLFCGIFGLALAALLNLAGGYLERHWIIGLARHEKLAQPCGKVKLD